MKNIKLTRISKSKLCPCARRFKLQKLQSTYQEELDNLKNNMELCEGILITRSREVRAAKLESLILFATQLIADSTCCRGQKKDCGGVCAKKDSAPDERT